MACSTVPYCTTWPRQHQIRSPWSLCWMAEKSLGVAPRPGALRGRAISASLSQMSWEFHEFLYVKQRQSKFGEEPYGDIMKHLISCNFYCFLMLPRFVFSSWLWQDHAFPKRRRGHPSAPGQDAVGDGWGTWSPLPQWSYAGPVDHMGCWWHMLTLYLLQLG